MDTMTNCRPLMTDELPFDVDGYDGVYKIYSDGGHFVGSRILQGVSTGAKRRTVSEIDVLFDSLYFEGFFNRGLRDKKVDKPLTAFIREGILAEFPDEEGVDSLIADGIKRKLNNLYHRKKRFRRKAYLNRWNYFVTFTYDEDKHTADEFKAKLRKTLSNFHSRRGWRYMGVFERGEETGHLHFHALVYIPDGEMPGKLVEKEEYSTKRHCMEKRIENTFFARRYGINDFQPLNAVAVRYGKSIDYCLKYIGKTGERIVYSRGIPTEICKHLTGDDIITEMIDFYGKYVFFDNVIEYDEEENVVRERYRRPIVA